MTTEHTPGEESDGASSAEPTAGYSAVLDLLGAAADIGTYGGRAPDTVSNTALLEHLRRVAPAERALDRAVLGLLGAARGRGLSWPRIGEALDLSADGARDRFDRAAERHPGYTAPLAPTLAAHRAHAARLIDALDEEMSPHTASTAATRLGAVLLTATLRETPSMVGVWLEQDTLAAAASAAAHHPSAEPAYRVLAEHARDRRGTRADLVDIMRAAVRTTAWAVGAPASAPPGLPAPGRDTVATAVAAAGWPQESAEHMGALVDAMRPLVPLAQYRSGPARALLEAVNAADGTGLLRAVAQLRAYPEALRGPLLGQAGERALEALPAGPAASDGGPAVPRGAPATDRLRTHSRGAGYAPVLVRAGLAPAAAAALAPPLTAFTATVELVKGRQRDGQMRGVLHALAPVLHSGEPTRVRLLLGALPRLDLVALEEWAVLALAVTEHAPHLDERTGTAALAALVEAAGLPSGAVRPLAELVDAARLAVLASYAPGAPASAVADDLAAVIVAVDTGAAADLPALLDRLVRAERLDLAADRPHRLTSAWEDLVYALARTERAGAGPLADLPGPGSAEAAPSGPGWEARAAAVIPGQPELAAAVARLLAAATTLVGRQKLGEGKTHEALYQLSAVVQAGNRATIGRALEGVLVLDPSRAPITKHPRLADALRALISVYDNQ